MSNLSEILKPENMLMDLSGGDKETVINKLIDQLVSTGALSTDNAEAGKKAVLKREALGSTGIGNGIAIPHAMVGFSDEFVCAYGHVESGMDYASLDGEDVYAIFLLLSPESKVDDHLGIMKELASFSREPINYNFLRSCASAESVVELLSDWRAEG